MKSVRKLSYLIVFFIIPFFITNPLLSQKKEKVKKEKKQKVLIEEIQITAKAPAEQPISTVSIIKKGIIFKSKAKNLSEVVHLIPGVHVSEGQKGEANINIRGLASNRITLMYDGIPIYEPYFNSFNLKSFSATEIDKIKVVKGASSVLYGANTLGGIVNIITQRPYEDFFNFNGNWSENSSLFLSGSGAYRLKDFSIYTSATWDKSNGYDWNDQGTKKIREWSDHNRRHIITKLYYSPTDHSEIMAEVLYTNSEYRIPPALDYFKERYWYFQDWDKLQIHLGGLFPFAKKGFIKLRSYLVHHYNVLNDYNNNNMEIFRWQSTYKNSSLGIFVLGEYPLSKKNILKFSFNSGFNRVNTQDDIGAEWEHFNRDLYSWGIEDHITLSDQFKLIGGFSLDLLNKNSGENKTSINPILGIKYYPNTFLNLHLSYARKSRFPSMKSLYSSSSGNPNLVDEIGQSFEIGITYNKSIQFSASVFYNVFTDMIQSYRGLDGYKNYQNIGKAIIKGFELQISKKIKLLDLQASYTYLDSNEKDLNQPLDYTPKHQFSMFITLGKIQGFSLSIWGKGVSDSSAKMGKKPPFKIITIPAYFLLNISLDKSIGKHTLYLKISNALDIVYFSEPGFPAFDRRISIGMNLLFK